VEDERQRGEGLVELGEMLPDDRLFLAWRAAAVQVLEPFDEDRLRLVVEAEVDVIFI